MRRRFVAAPGWWLAPASFLLLLAAYHVIFGRFFPASGGALGVDYSRVVPDLLDGYFWVKSNGALKPFWFTPAFCGGQPALGVPDSAFYSIPQFLSFFIDPVHSVYGTVLLFASLGFWGTYLLLRTGFNCSRQAAVFGAGVFMFNGFFIHRMLVGHFAFHAVMLIPWGAYFLLRPAARGPLGDVINGAAAGSTLAYGVYSGMVHLLLPWAFAVLGIVSIHELTRRRSPGLLFRSLCAATVALGLSAAKLTAALLFLAHFPRDDYSLPGLASMWDALRLVFQAMFISPTNLADQAHLLMLDERWKLDRHEWEYGLTVIPLLFVLVGMPLTLARYRDLSWSRVSARWGWCLALVLVLLTPLALNTYAPSWNDLLKQIPVIRSSSNLLRWFAVYVPLATLWSALMFDVISSLPSHRRAMLLIALSLMVWINATKDRRWYDQARDYRPDIVVNAWNRVHEGRMQPGIQYIAAIVNAQHQMLLARNRNDVLAVGGSQLACYNPIFGYQLEHFPIKSLRPGPVMAQIQGVLNIKNAACYTYPEENHCSPGDHFTASQREAAHAFANYQPYAFNFSMEQQVANVFTLATLTLLAALFVAACLSRAARARQDRATTQA